ncbi:MAG: hypothetical protein H6948_16180 [Zoogloeaceae bacterium]|nr:phage tail protein [Rhodocyclaceae bacterium]MCP5233589.1 hypothetical protein [Zoogloeaceae bacterium]
MFGGFDIVNESPRLDKIEMGGSSYGSEITIVYGTARLPANLVFGGAVETTKHTDKQSMGKGGGGGTVKTVTYSYACTLAYLICAGTSGGVHVRKAWGSGQLIYDASGDSLTGHNVDRIQIYGGTEFQGIDPSMEAEQPGATPAYRGRALMVCNLYDLTEKFSNRPPSMQVEVCERATVTGTRIDPYAVSISEIVLDVCDRAGIPSTSVDVSGMMQTVHGWWFAGNFRAAIERIGEAFGVRMRDDAGTLVFYETDALEVEVDIPAEHLGAEDGYREPGELIPVEYADEQDLPGKVTITYRDIDRDGLSCSQTVMRLTVGSTQEDAEEYPAMMDATAARRIADKRLYRRWVEAAKYGPVKLGPQYLYLRPGHVVRITDDEGTVHAVRLTRVTIGADWRLEVEGVAHEASIATSYVDGVGTDYTPITIASPGTTYARLLNLPPLADADASAAGFYLAAAGASPAWRQAVIFGSPDGGLNWSQLAVLSAYTDMGWCNTTLADPPASIGAANFDLVSVLEVNMLRGQLVSVSDEQLFAGANLALIGAELVQFGLAELIAPATYRLSRLLRGRRASEAAMTGHGVGEDFTLLTSLAFVPLPLALLGSERAYKVVPIGGAIEDEGTIAFTATGRTLKPWAPINIRGARDSSGNLAITWQRRSRVGAEMSNEAGDIALDEPVESYRIEVLDGATVVRTITVTAPAATYADSQQTADFGGLQSAVTVRLAQLSSVVGAGYTTTTTI